VFVYSLTADVQSLAFGDSFVDAFTYTVERSDTFFY